MFPAGQTINEKTVPTQKIKIAPFTANGIETDVLRLDVIHPVVSGNKLFKLTNYLQEAIQKNYRSILTFGGAYSNHIVATAYAAAQQGIPSIGIIRGGEGHSHTLKTAAQYGMQLEKISREAYREKDSVFFRQSLQEKYPGCYIIPEGGWGEPGIRGCAAILQMTTGSRYSHICCAIGTGTMWTGLARAAAASQYVIGVPVLKGLPDLLQQFAPLIGDPGKLSHCSIRDGYHFGGYARKTAALIDFMNRFYQHTGIPTDFVYTAKLFYAIADMIVQKEFPAGSRILIIHSGGLQGNLSLKEGMLKF